MITVTCNNCKQLTKKLKGEHKRQIKNKGADSLFFCNLSCAASYNNKHRTEDQTIKNNKHLLSYNIKRRERYNTNHPQFSYYITKAKTRSKRKKFNTPVNITHGYLNNLWIEQGGKCAISGISLIINPGKMKETYNAASLDRINSSIGYIKGNVQFVAWPFNLAKANTDDKQFKQFLLEVAASITKSSVNDK